MSYSQIGYVPAERRVLHNGELTRTARLIFFQLRAMAHPKDGPTKREGKIVWVKKGEGHFSQLRLAGSEGCARLTIRNALRELDFHNLIRWGANEFGTTFKILIDAAQKAFDGLFGGVERFGSQVKCIYSSISIYRDNHSLYSKRGSPPPDRGRGERAVRVTQEWIKAFDEYQGVQELSEETKAFLRRNRGMA
jgi:hypothetical protein